MKVRIVQYRFGPTAADLQTNFNWILSELDACDESLDVIVLPEGCHDPAPASCRSAGVPPAEPGASAPGTDQGADGSGGAGGSPAKGPASLNATMLAKCVATAKRCRAAVFVNARYDSPTGPRNSTFAFAPDGSPAGRYDKQNLTPGEHKTLDDSYTRAFNAPTVVEIGGVRYAFLTCYDFYFVEQWEALARVKPDVVIGCSRQRTDTHEALGFQNRTCAYVTGAYLLRASVSMGEDSPTGGCSCAIAPDGTVLGAFTNDVGHFDVEFDPHKKFLKKAGYVGNVVSTHPEYVERGRRPCKYRPAGSAIAPFFAELPSPRLCAHRGIHNDTLPENSIPALGAAVALGASEIEFDLWPSKDGTAIAIHDCTLERVSDGAGLVMDHTLEELRRVDFGAKSGLAWRGLRPATFEEVMDKLACHTTINLHIKGRGEIGEPWSVEAFDRVLRIIDDHDARRHVYFMVSGESFVRRLKTLAPDIPIILGYEGCKDGAEHVQVAHDLGCAGLQFFKPHFTTEDVARARSLGLRCNCFWSDDPAEARTLLDMGMDTILTNDWLALHTALGLS